MFKTDSLVAASAEREGFEPPVPLGTTVFKTVVIDHSTISPKGAYECSLILQNLQFCRIAYLRVQRYHFLFVLQRKCECFFEKSEILFFWILLRYVGCA